MYNLNDKIKKLTPYDPVAGTYKVRLDANESFINPGKSFEDKIKKAIETINFNRYPDPTCEKLRNAFGKAYSIKPELVVAGNGSDEIITILLGAFLQIGDKVATVAPDFSMYGFYCETYEKEHITLAKKDDLTIDVDSLICEINKIKPAAFIFSNPCSPTSIVLPKEDVVKLVKEAETLVVLDEAYMEFSNQSLINDVESYDNLIVLKTCSKAWGLAALRLGFAISNKKIINALNAVRSPYNVNSITQAIGTIILSDLEYIEDAKKQILMQSNELYEILSPLKNQYIIVDDEKSVEILEIEKPDTNFVFLKFKNNEEAKLLYNALLKKSIIVRILGNYIRITAGSKAENQQLKDALKV